MKSWAAAEMETADFGDERLNSRVVLLLEKLGQKPQISIPAACGGWAETMGAYRFFDNPKATFEKVLAPHQEATLQRMSAAKVVLLAQDTTEDDETLNLGPKGLGTLKETAKRDRRLHPTIAFTPERICLGVVRADYWNREEASPRAERRYKGVDEKESRYWIESYQASCALQGQLSDTMLVNVADREGDLYELFVEYASHAPQTQAQWIVRAAQNRRLQRAHKKEGPHQKLWDTLAQSPTLGQLKVEVSARPNRPARTATVTVRSATVQLEPPARVGYHLPALAINAVWVCEEDPPAKVEALEWMLLTSLPVDTYERATTVVAWYAVRWCIEIYFHVLKSGCQIKELQLETEERQLPCLALYMIIAWRVLFTMMLGRSCPELDCEIIFERKEWQAAYIVHFRKPPPATPPSLGELVTVIAQLGGYLNRKHDGPPGPQTIWIGLQRLSDFVIALDAAAITGQSCV
ncbi:MAG: IS4 family transposase [Gammaproteobacteria bacterium]|nr:IS4 family transposase [Gammaproteobacteria bacterium]